MTARILIVEDERGIQIALAALLKRESYEVTVASSGDEAIRLIDDTDFDLVLTDLALGKGKSGMDVLEKVRKSRAESPVVMITAHGNERVAVEAMQAGAADYVPKPFDNDQLRLVVRRALERTRLTREHRLLLDRIEKEYGFGSIVGSGPDMERVFQAISRVAETDLTVLVRGESGSGKELVAQALHYRSPRRDRPFVAVNCAAISRELVESELFGHEKGAFTGADARRAGRFEAANGGTIFLDEIGDMPIETQAKVLRVLQERVLERVGGHQPIPLDVRVVAATHRDLESEVEAGRFREDLYYRLKVVTIEVPPLRERRRDIPALAERFLQQLSTRLTRPKKTLTEGALAKLCDYAWPGNVRELKNAIEQAAVLSAGAEIGADELELGRRKPRGARSMPDRDLPFAEAKRLAVEEFEKGYLVRALEAHEGNISRTAEAIGMVRQSLQQKLRELGIKAKEHGGES